MVTNNGHSPKKSSGTQIVSAVDAGVVRDEPAPQDWLDLAATLPNAPQPQAPDIQEGQVTLSSMDFGKRFKELHRRHRTGTLAMVRIDEPLAGLAADFTFGSDVDMAGKHCINTRDLRVNGVAACLKGHDEVVVLDGRNEGPIGVLSSRAEIAPDLQAAAGRVKIADAQVVQHESEYRIAATRILSLVKGWEDMKQMGVFNVHQGVPLLSGGQTVARVWDPQNNIPTTDAIDMSDVRDPDCLRNVFAHHAAVRLNPWVRSKVPKNPVIPEPDSRLIITAPDFRIGRDPS